MKNLKASNVVKALAYDQGHRAAQKLTQTENPYRSGSDAHSDWERGFLEGKSNATSSDA